MDAGSIDIHTIEVDGGGNVKLTENQGDNEAPSWSPDGSLIVFNSTREGQSKIYVMTAFGTDQRRLISMPGAQTNPKWSPSVISK
jgi:TolB protein